MTESTTSTPNLAPGQQQIRLHIDERELKTTYANAFRTHVTPDEVFLDLGLNILTKPPTQENDKANPGEMMLQLQNRTIMNFATAKRLAITLGQVIRAHEERFGEIKLDANQRPAK